MWSFVGERTIPSTRRMGSTPARPSSLRAVTTSSRPSANARLQAANQPGRENGGAPSRSASASHSVKTSSSGAGACTTTRIRWAPVRNGQYAHVPSASGARMAIDLASPWPARFCASVIDQALRYGLPARRRGGTLLAILARAGLPRRPLAEALRRFPKRRRPDLDRALADLGPEWARLAAACERLPAEAPELTALALKRASATTVFVFADAPQPLLVLKIPGARDRLQNEADALERAAALAVAPRFLGQVGEAYVQEALWGEPLRVEPLSPARSRDLAWSPSHHELAGALARLASATAVTEKPSEFDEPLDAALGAARLSAAARPSLAQVSV